MSSLVLKDRYAGEAAWTEWFEICSVAGCCDEHATKLRAEIESAMTSQLLRCGFSVEDAGGDDPVAFFDSYFKLKGSREKGKPLKLYFAHRIQAEHLRMLDFVCGTLFGSRSGRIHDIVVDWISSLKGWKARIVRGEDGCRRLRWESTGESERQVEMPVDCDPAAEIDVEPYVAYGIDKAHKLGLKVYEAPQPPVEYGPAKVRELQKMTKKEVRLG